MALRFQQRVCVVTGGSEGIGLAVARQMLCEGAGAVLICGRSEEKLDQARQELGHDRLHTVRCHIGRPDDRQQLVEAAKALVESSGLKEGGLVLVLNAAISPPIPTIMDTSPEAFSKILSTNVVAQLAIAQQFESELADTGAPLRSVCLVSSVGGYMPGAPHPAYSVSKTALFGLTRALAEEMAPEVRVNCVAPGVTETRFSQPIWANESIKELIEARSLLGRLAKPEEVAMPVCFLCSDDASFITAEVLVIAGGMPAARL